MFVVGEPPKFIKPLKDTEVTIPGVVRLQAEVDLGEPQADVRWFKEWKELYPGDEYSMSVVKGRAQLEITEPKTGHSGKYHCTLKNALGEDECEAKLFIISKYCAVTALSLPEIRG